MYQIGESNRKNPFGSENRIETFLPELECSTTRVSRYQKGKTNLDFTEARDSEWQWHQLGVCKSVPRSRQTTTPAPHHCFFTGRMPFLPPNQQRQSTEGFYFLLTKSIFKVQKPRPAWKEQACSWMDWRYYVACSLTVLSVHQALQTQTVHQVIIITTIISIIIITWSPIYKISYDLL